MVQPLPTKASELASCADDTVAFWHERNARMQDDETAWAAEPRLLPEKLTLDRHEVVTSNEIRNQLDMGQALLGGKPPELDVALDQLGDRQRAQRGENWLKAQRTGHEQQHGGTLRGALAMTETHSALLRGWLTTRILWRPPVDADGQVLEDAARYPFDCEILDPYQVYPRLGARGIDAIYHRCEYTVADVKAAWPRAQWDAGAKKALDRKDDKEVVTLTEVYTDTELAALIGTDFVKKPQAHGYGMNPVICMVAKGAFWRRDPEAGGQADPPNYDGRRSRSGGTWARAHWQRYVGVSFVDAIRQQCRDKEESLSILRYMLAQMALPPGADFTKNPREAPDLPRGVSGDQHYEIGDNVQFYPPPGVAIQGQTAYLSALQRYIDTGALGPAAWGGGTSESGFDRTQQSQAAFMLLLPFVELLREYYVAYYGRMLRLFGQWGAPSPFLMTMNGVRQLVPPFEPDEAVGMDYGLDVRFRSLNTQDQMMKAQIGAIAQNGGVLSKETIRKEYFDTSNPSAEDEKILIEQARAAPEVAQIYGFRLAARDAEENGADPTLVQTLNEMAQAVLIKVQMGTQQVMQQAQQAQQPQAPPMPGSGAPSIANPANPVLPDEMGQNAGLPPGTSGVGQPAPPEAGLALGPGF